MIIDFHTHTFPSKIASRVVEQLATAGHIEYYSDGSAEKLAASMKESGIDYSVNLPVMTRVDQVESVNSSLIKRKEELFEEGIITFGGLHPDYENYEEEIKKLVDAGIKGVKFHPAYQGVYINDIRYKRIVSKLSEAGLISIFHTGWDVGYPYDDFASVKGILELIEDVHPEKLVLAHFGGWQNWADVRKYLAGAPVWFDTAVCFGTIKYRDDGAEHAPFYLSLSEEEFVLTARTVGVEKVLFASDSPWAPQGMYVDFVKNSSLTEEEKDMVFSLNARKLLGI